MKRKDELHSETDQEIFAVVYVFFAATWPIRKSVLQATCFQYMLPRSPQ